MKKLILLMKMLVTALFMAIVHMSLAQMYTPADALSTDNINYARRYTNSLNENWYTEFRWVIDFKLEIETPLFEPGGINKFYIHIKPIHLTKNISNALAPKTLRYPALTFGDNGDQVHDRIIMILCPLLGGGNYTYNHITMTHDRFAPGDYYIKSKTSDSDNVVDVSFSVGVGLGPFSLDVTPSDPDPFDLRFTSESKVLDFGFNMCAPPFLPIKPMYYDGASIELYDLYARLDEDNDSTEIGEIVVQLYPNRLLNYNIFEYEEIYDLRRITLTGKYVRANAVRQPTVEFLVDSSDYEIGDTVNLNLYVKNNSVVELKNIKASLINIYEPTLSTSNSEIELETLTSKDSTLLTFVMTAEQAGKVQPQVTFGFEWGYPATNKIDSDIGIHQLDKMVQVFDPNGLDMDTRFMITQYPNPAANVITIEYTIEKPTMVNLDLYDIKGKKILSLINEFQFPDTYSVNFDISGYDGYIYFYKFNTNDFTETNKIIRY